jgi:hypothetical protein
MILFRSLVRLARRQQMKYTDFLGVLFSLLSLAFAVFSYALFLATGEQTLLGRGLIFFVFAGAVCMALFLQGNSSRGRVFKAKSVLAAGLIMLLFASFPIISYSREAYNTFTPSSGEGLSFLSSHADLSTHTVSASADQQLAAYVNLSRGIMLVQYPPDLNESNPPDFVVLRINLYFAAAIRYDYSFSNNSYTRLRDSLEASVGFDKVYSNPAFDVYSSLQR